VRWRRATDEEEDSVAVEVPDSWGLTGKVAVVTGGGAAGDGIGNGRAAAILRGCTVKCVTGYLQ